MHENLANVRGGLYLWCGVGLVLFAVAVYLSQPAALPPNGGSWQGYTLGGIGLALILWLSWLGVRKRSYRSRLGTVQGWTSAHVWLGLALLPIGFLHAAFQLGLNVHTMALVLMVAVVLSGLYGLFAYSILPRRLAETLGDKNRDQWLTELNRIDARLRELAVGANARTQALVESAIERTSLGGGVLAQLFAGDRSRLLDPDRVEQGAKLVANRGQQRLVDYLAQAVPKAERRGEAALLQELLALASRRRMVLATLRRAVQLQARLRAWLYLHIPLTVALLAALAVHVLVVFLYW
ncbi:MAG: hypothetical protein AB7V26_11320 [Lysobacterales bacterium]